MRSNSNKFTLSLTTVVLLHVTDSCVKDGAVVSYVHLCDTTCWDATRDNSYEVTAVANLGASSSAPISLTVAVIDEDEEGQLTLSTTKPQVGQVLTASLSDPDTVSGTVVWTWERSAGRNRWVTIAGATASSYTPVDADSGEYLRITATYGDDHGTGKSVSAALHNVVMPTGWPH